jgi:cyclohexa-1,5-dienecarbonyl-CoA hydratase
MPPVEVSVNEGVARVTLDRPPLNVVDLASAAPIATAIEALATRDDVAVVVLSARGRAFSAGVDVRDHLPDRCADMLRGFHRVCRALLDTPAPVIAAVHGAALGGGLELTLCCDVVVASSEATFGLPEIKLGVYPPFAAVALPRMIATPLATELLLTGRTIDATEAARIGLVNRVAAPERLEAVVEETVAAFTALSPASLRLAKRALRLARVRPGSAEVLEAERFYVQRLMTAPDAIEGLEAFMEKRAPVWGKKAPAKS